MATNIYLGLPPPNVVKWIKENYKKYTLLNTSSNPFPIGSIDGNEFKTILEPNQSIKFNESVLYGEQKQENSDGSGYIKYGSITNIQYKYKITCNISDYDDASGAKVGIENGPYEYIGIFDITDAYGTIPETYNNIVENIGLNETPESRLENIDFYDLTLNSIKNYAKISDFNFTIFPEISCTGVKSSNIVEIQKSKLTINNQSGKTLGLQYSNTAEISSNGGVIDQGNGLFSLESEYTATLIFSNDEKSYCAITLFPDEATDSGWYEVSYYVDNNSNDIITTEGYRLPTEGNITITDIYWVDDGKSA